MKEGKIKQNTNRCSIQIKLNVHLSRSCNISCRLLPSRSTDHVSGKQYTVKCEQFTLKTILEIIKQYA